MNIARRSSQALWSCIFKDRAGESAGNSRSFAEPPRIALTCFFVTRSGTPLVFKRVILHGWSVIVMEWMAGLEPKDVELLRVRVTKHTKCGNSDRVALFVLSLDLQTLSPIQDDPSALSGGGDGHSCSFPSRAFDDTGCAAHGAGVRARW
jgi:hypothetical protein